MTATRLFTIGLATAATALAGTATATAQQSGDAVRGADLVALSNGAYLHYQLDDGARTQSVTIAGRTAKVRAVDGEGDNAFHALMSGKKVKTGGTYTVVVRVERAGKTVVFRDRLVVHRRHARAS